jgi:hypothetical protein
LPTTRNGSLDMTDDTVGCRRGGYDSNKIR